MNDSNLTGNGTRVVTAAPGPLTQGLPLTYNAEGNAVPTAMQTPHQVNYPVNVPFVDSGFTAVNWDAQTSVSFDGDIFIMRRPTVVANDFQLYVEPLPSAPYRIWSRIMVAGRLIHPAQLAGLCWYDEVSGVALVFGQRANGPLLAYRISKVTPIPAFLQFFDAATPPYAQQSGALSIGLEGDTEKKRLVFCPSLQYSRTFIEFGVVEHITPTHAGLWVANGQAGGDVHLEVLSYVKY